MNALAQTEQAEEYINRFALRELVEEWLSRASVECPEDPYQYLIDEATDQRRSGGGIVTCPNSWCNMTMPASRFPDHQQTCNNAANWVRCVRCNLRVDAAKMSQHRLFCKLERCTLCGEMVLPRMLPVCPYRKVAKAERDRQAALHRRERRLERALMDGVPPLPNIAASQPFATLASNEPRPSLLPPPPPPPPAASTLAAPSLAGPQSQTPVSTTIDAVGVAKDGAEVRPIMKAASPRGHTPSPARGQDSENKPASSTPVNVIAPAGGSPQRGKSLAKASAGDVATGAPAAADSANGPSVPRPSFPAFLAADKILREKLESYPDALVPVLSSVQTLWRRNMSLHLFREQVFSAVWRHMDCAQEGAAGQSKEGAAIRLVERNLRTDRRISSTDEGGVLAGGNRASTNDAPVAGSMEEATGAAAESNSGARDKEFCAEEAPTPSFQADPVHVSDSLLSNGGYMRVRDFEALMRHCQAREVLQFSVVLKIVRAATKVLQRRPLVQHIAIPAGSSLLVVGDLHGQMKDLEYILNYMGLPSAERYYLFNGDFIDRGPYGCEVLMFIYGLVCAYPDYVFLNRGNHENYATNTEYGFMAELYAKYAGRASYLLDAMTDSYEVMPLMSIIDKRVAVVHGGVPRLECKLDEIEAIGHVRNIPVEQQTTRAEQLLAELLWNDPVEKFRSRQLGMNHQGDGWRSSSRGCGVEYLTSITEQFLKNNDLKLLIRSHDVKSAGFELVHKNKSITVFSASNYGGVSGNRGAVAVLTKEAEQPVFHTWFLKEDLREHQQDGLLDDSIDAVLQDDRIHARGLGSSPIAHDAALTKSSQGSTIGALVVASGTPGASSTNQQNGLPCSGAGQPQQSPRRINAAMIAESALMEGDEFVCAYYLCSGLVLDEDDLASDVSSRSSAFSDSEDPIGTGENATSSSDAVDGGGSGAPRGFPARIRTPPTKKSGANVTGSPVQRWPTGAAGGSSMAMGNSSSNINGGRVAAAGSRGMQVSLVSHSSQNSVGCSRIGCALAQDMGVTLQLQTLQQIRELIYFQRYALLVAFNQVDEMHTGTVYKAEWCVVMREVLKLDIPWYYLCQFLAPRLMVDGVASVEYMRFLRHFDVCFAIDYRLSWQRSTIQRISSGLDIPEDIINAFCERPAMNVRMTTYTGLNGAMSSSTGNGADKNLRTPPVKLSTAERLTSPLTPIPREFPLGGEGGAPRQSSESANAGPEKSWNLASAQGDSDASNFADPITGEEPPNDDEDWWCDIQLDFKTFAMKVRVLSPAAAAMEDNEIFALFCFFDLSMQGHVYVGDLVNSVIAVVGDEGSVDEAELMVGGELDFSAVRGGGRTEGRGETCGPRSPSSSSSSSGSPSSASSDSSSSKASEGAQPSSNTVMHTTGPNVKSPTDATLGGVAAGARGLLTSKFKMTGVKPRLMRPPSSDEEKEDDGDGGSPRRDTAHSASPDLSSGEEKADTRALTPSASTSTETEDCTRAFVFPATAPVEDFLARVASAEPVKEGEGRADANTAGSIAAGGKVLVGRNPLHPSSGDESDSDSSIASTRHTASARSSDAVRPASKAKRSRASDAEGTQGDASNSGFEPPTLASTARGDDVDVAVATSSTWVLPLDYDDDDDDDNGESDPNGAGATVPPEPASCDLPAMASVAGTSLAENVCEGSTVDVGSGASNLIVADESTSASLLHREVKDARKSGYLGDAPRGPTAHPVAVAAPSSLQRVHSFNEYAVSMASAVSTSLPNMASSRPFDNYSTTSFQMNAGNGSGSGAGSAGLAPETVEQRVNKRLAVPPWIYPTLLRVQEQLLGGFTRLRFLFQALNRTRNGHLTESEFLPLMEFMNCLLEHPLAAEQAHMLFLCVHDSAVSYVHSTRNRRRRRSGSFYSEGMEPTSSQRSPAGNAGAGESAKPMADSDVMPDTYSYARARARGEQARGERYILITEFLAFFCVKPMQFEDEVEGLEELVYRSTGARETAAATVISVFDDPAQEASVRGVDGGRPFSSARFDLDNAATTSNGSVSATALATARGSETTEGIGGGGAERLKPGSRPVKGESVEPVTSMPFVADTVVATRPLTADAGKPSTNASSQQRRRSSAAVPPSTLSATGSDVSVSVKRPSGRLGSDPSSNTTAKQRSSVDITRRRMSSALQENSGAFFQAVHGSGGPAARPGMRRRVSSVPLVVGPNTGGSGSMNGGQVTQASVRSSSVAGSATFSLADSMEMQPRVSVMPASIDVFTALATLGDVYGGDITINELMLRVATSQSCRSRVSMQPHDAHRLHRLPLVLGASSLSSFSSDVTEAKGGTEDAPNAQVRRRMSHHGKRGALLTAPATEVHKRQHQHWHQNHQNQPPTPPHHQLQQRRSQSKGKSSGAVTTHLAANVALPTGIALPHTPDGAKYTTRLAGRSPPNNDAELSLVSLQGKASSRNTITTTATSPTPVQTPPPGHALSMSRNAGASSHHRLSSFLEASIASLAARPYLLNQAEEQRLTVMEIAPFAPHLSGTSPSASMHPTMPGNYVITAGGSSVAGANFDFSGKRGSSEARRSVVVAMPAPVARYHQRVNGAPATKSGTMLMSTTNATGESELLSMSLVPSIVFPPAPPTRKSAALAGSVSASDSSPASHVSSTFSVNDHRSASGTVAVSAAPARKKRLQPSSTTTSLMECSVGAVDRSSASPSGIGSANAMSDRKRAQQQQQQQQVSLVSPASSPSPKRRPPLRASSETPLRTPQAAAADAFNAVPPAKDIEQVQGLPSASKDSSSPTETPSGSPLAIVQTAVAFPLSPGRSPNERSRAKAKLDTYIASAKAMGITSPPTAAATPPETAPIPPNIRGVVDSGVSAGDYDGGGVASAPPIPTPPPLQTHQLDVDEALPAAVRDSRPVAVDKTDTLRMHNGAAEANAETRSPLFDVEKAQNQSSSEMPEVLRVAKGRSRSSRRSSSSAVAVSGGGGGGASTETTNRSSSLADSAAPHSCTSTIVPAARSQMLSGELPATSSTAHSTFHTSGATSLSRASRSSTSTLASPLLKSSPLLQDRHAPKRAHGPGKAILAGAVESHNTAGMRGSASADNNSSSGETPGGKVHALPVAPTSTGPSPVPSATALKGQKTNVQLTVDPNEGSMMSVTSISSGSRPARRNKGRKGTDTTPAEAGGTPTPPSPPNDIAAHGAGPRGRAPRGRLPAKAAVTSTDVMQRMYGGGGGGGGGSSQKSRGSNSGRSLTGSTTKANSHGSVAASTSRRSNASTSEESVQPSTARESTPESSRRRLASEQRNEHAGNDDAPHESSELAPSALATTGMVPYLPSPLLSEAAEQRVRYPAAKLTTADEVVRGSKMRNGRQSHRGRSRVEDGDATSPLQPDARTIPKNTSTASAVLSTPLSSAMPHAMPPRTAHAKLPSTRASNMEALPAIERSGTSSGSSVVSSPGSTRGPRGTGPHLHHTKSPLQHPLPLPPSSASSGSPLSTETASGGGGAAVASAAGYPKSAAPPIDGATAGAKGRQRAPAQGPAGLRMMEEESRMLSVNAHSALSPPHHTGTTLKPLVPLAKH